MEQPIDAPPSNGISTQQIWENAEQQFERLTGKNLRVSPPRTFKHVTSQIESRPTDGDSEATERKTKIKEGCIDVFAPANLCFNAISILLDIPRKIHEFHELIGGILDHVSPFLKQFRIYQRMEETTGTDSIDQFLFEIVNETMICFVGLCAKSIKLGKNGGWRRLYKSMEKALLDKDDGIGEELERFRSLLERQSHMQQTLTLEQTLKTNQRLATFLVTASDTNQKTEEIRTGVAKLNASEILKEQLNKIYTKLGIKPDIIDQSDSECHEAWTRCVPDTGKWRHENEDYQEWIRAAHNSSSLLLLTGNSNCGKSHFVSATVHERRSSPRDPQESRPKLIVASYFFPKLSEKGQKVGQENQSVGTALKCMSVQIAKQDAKYAKYMAGICDLKDEQYFKKMTCRDLWSVLIFNSPQRDVTYNLFFDGLDRMSAPQNDAKELLEKLVEQENVLQTDQARVRVFASGTSTTFESQIFYLIPKIEIQRTNVLDIRTFTERTLRRYDLLQGSGSEIVRPRELVLDRLPRVVEGSFSKAENALNKINLAIDADYSPQEIEKIVDEAEQGREVIAKNVIAELHDHLSIKGIRELNELLVWVMYGYRWFTVEELQAALYLRFNNTSLKPLKKKLEGKYAQIFEVSDGFVAHNEAITRSLTMDQRKSQSAEDSPKISATITITQADQRTVHSFLWALCEKAIIDKFDFSKANAAVERKPSIQVNELDANLAIVKTSLTLLELGDVENAGSSLIPYMLEFLPFHLRDLTSVPNIDKLTVEEKAEPGKMIYTLFDEEQILEREGDNLGEIAYSWMSPGLGMRVFWKFLADKDALKHLAKKDREWLDQIKCGANPHQDLLYNITVMVAKHWLQGREWSTRNTYRWIYKFLDMRPADEPRDVDSEEAADISKLDDNSCNTSEPGPEDGNKDTIDDSSDDDMKSNSCYKHRPSPVAQGVIRAEEWAQKALNVKDKDTLWHERLGQTYLSFDDPTSAIKAFEASLRLDENSWRCVEGLASAHEELENYLSACNEMNRAMIQLEKDESLDKIKRQDKILQYLSNLADWNAQLERITEAIECYQKALELDVNTNEVQYKLLKLMLTSEREANVRDFLHQHIERDASASEHVQLAAIFTLLIEDDESDTLFALLFAATHCDPVFSDLVQQMQQAIELAEKESRIVDQAALLLYLGMARYYYDKSEGWSPEAARNLWITCCALRPRDFKRPFSDYYNQAISFLSLWHYEQAKYAYKSGRAAHSHTEWLELINTDRSQYRVEDEDLSLYISYCHSHILGEFDKTKKVFFNDVNEGVDLLSDEADWNDSWGFYKLANVFTHYGDDLDALSAWSMLGPSDAGKPLHEREVDTERSGDLVFECGGECGKTWGFANDFHCCRICLDMRLCSACFEKVEAGTMKKFICSKFHERLHVPKWDDDEYERIGVNRIKYGGRMENGVRIGGEPILIEEWLDKIRDAWSIPRPEK